MTLIYFVIILGITIFIHELGHFLFAKKAGVYCYEFSLGMGPKIFGFRRKNDETEYSIRLFPIGGYVKMAGEEIEEDNNIPVKKRIQSKSFIERFFVITAGAIFNFLLGILLLFIIGLIYGSAETRPYIGNVDKSYNAYKAGIREGDLILTLDDKKVKTWDDVLMDFQLNKSGASIEFEVKHSNGKIDNIVVNPTEEVKDGKTVHIYGIGMTDKKNYGFGSAIEFAFTKFISIYRTMIRVIANLITGNLGIGNLAGPVGIYNIVGEQAKVGFENLLYLVAFLCINVGFVNLIPFPAFDGGRAVFLLIEKITKKPVNTKVENTIHTIGFALLMLLMIIITVQDIKNIIK